MVDDPDFAAALAARLAGLRVQFLHRLEGTLAAFGEQLAGPGAGVAPAVLQDVHAQLHRLAGTGGTFGYPELSRQARSLELQAQVWLDVGAAIPPAEWDAWKAGVLGLRQTVSAAPDSQGEAPSRS